MQVVDYDTGTGASEPPALVLAIDGRIERRSLAPGTELDYALDERRCAGTLDGDAHLSCDETAAPYCDAHTSTWVCARCTGNCLKDEMDCYEEHAVYLAAFAPATIKVGVTRSWRLETRLREQGADRAAHVHTVSNGRIAREVEAEMASNLTDRVRVPTKIEGLHREVDEDLWTAVLDEHEPIETRSFGYGLDLETMPVPETVASGTVRGVKGRILVLDNGGSVYAVDLRDLVGYVLDDGGSDRELQSSLGAFG